MKGKQIVSLILLILLSGLIYAQDKLVLDLTEARSHALQYNKTLKNSSLASEKSVLQLKEAIAAGLPQVSATMDYSNALGASISIRFNEDMPASEIPIRPTSNFNLRVNQLLFSGNYFVGLQLARLGTTLTSKSHEKNEQEVIAQVTDSYYLVLLSGEMLKLLELNMKNLKEIYAKTAAMEVVGIIEKTDVDQLSVQISALQNAVNSAQRQLEMAKNMLRLQLGVSAETGIELTEELGEVLTKVTSPGMQSPLFNVQQNLDYQLVEFQEQLSEKQVLMAQSNYLPTLVGFYARTEKILKPDFDMSPKNMVGLSLTIPIFSGGTRMAQVKQAKVDLETARNTKALLNEQLEIQNKQLQFNLRNAMETYTNQVANLDVSRRVYNNLKLKFEHGMISGLDLVTADNNYVKAETDYISAIYQILSARVQLDKLYGQLK